VCGTHLRDTATTSLFIYPQTRCLTGLMHAWNTRSHSASDRVREHTEGTGYFPEIIVVTESEHVSHNAVFSYVRVVQFLTFF
jgi:hypothetical protein